MASLRIILIRFLAAVLLLQSGVAMAHCLRGMAAGEGMLVEICSTEGMRTIRLDASGEPTPDHAPNHSPGGEGGFCPLCHGLPVIALPEPPRLATPAWLGTAITWQAQGEERLFPPARAPPYRTRAPPITA